MEEHRRRAVAAGFEKNKIPGVWRVESVVESTRCDDVFCAVVPNGNQFTLEDNILTGNCGGFCIRGGHGHFRTLLETMPERYAHHEQQEKELREYLNGTATILRDRRGGKTRPLSLTEFRERIEARNTGMLDLEDFGGCGCAID